MFKKKFILTFILLCLSFQYIIPVYALDYKHPDYAYEYVGEDKWEKFNRKMFNFNLKLNKYAIRPIHILWASIVPKYAMDRLRGITNNIEYPIRMVSSLIQKDLGAVKTETIRFLTNSTIGLGGMFDPAKYFFKIEQADENMEQALAKCKVKQGNFLVLPLIAASSIRDCIGRILDIALNPGTYVGTPVLAAVKAGLTINRTSYMQPLIKMVESTFADPYMITKQAFGLERHLKCQNFDRVKLSDLISKAQLEETKVLTENKPAKAPVTSADKIVEAKVISPVITQGYLQGGANIDHYGIEKFSLTPDIILKGYNPQNPVVDSMRTALFNIPEASKSFWSEYSIWNRSFFNRIKTSSINIFEGRDNYNFSYILQKDKNSPLVIIYPSIGEGIMSEHSILFAKIFYDAGYSILIQGSHFQWEFVKSMPADYRPGLAQNDAKYLRITTKKIIDKLEKKYEKTFTNKVIIGTSFGAYEALFVAGQEFENNTLGDVKYISICPPIELLYAMNQVDKNASEWKSDDFKNSTSSTAAKVLKLYNAKNEQKSFYPEGLPFDEYEGKLITSFIMHQKLSDLVFTIENGSKNPSQTYEMIKNMNFKDYMEKYLVSDKDSNYDDLVYETSLTSLSNYFENNDNYKIYHSVNDYLTNSFQLKKLKDMTGDNMKLFDNGAHLGFMYRNEFINEIKNLISLK